MANGGARGGRALAGELQAHRERDSLLVGGLVSVWVGVTAQSLASFDVAGLLVLSMVTAGLLAGLAWPDGVVSRLLPGARPVTTRRGKSSTERFVPPAWAVPVGWVLAGALVLGGIVFGTKPFRAEQAASDGADATPRALELIDQALELSTNFPVSQCEILREGVRIADAAGLQTVSDIYTERVHKLYEACGCEGWMAQPTT